MHVLRVYYTRERTHLCILNVNAFKHMKQVNDAFWSTSKRSIRQMQRCTTLHFSCTTISLTLSFCLIFLQLFCTRVFFSPWDAQLHSFLSIRANLPHNIVHILVRLGGVLVWYESWVQYSFAPYQKSGGHVIKE